MEEALWKHEPGAARALLDDLGLPCPWTRTVVGTCSTPMCKAACNHAAAGTQPPGFHGCQLWAGAWAEQVQGQGLQQGAWLCSPGGL